MKPEFVRLFKRLEKVKKEIKTAQDACPHASYDVLRRGNDHDGWSYVLITYSETRKCLDCGKIWSETTGQSYY